MVNTILYLIFYHAINLSKKKDKTNYLLIFFPEFLNALNDCEFARFAPGDENQAMDKVYSSSIEVISKMENSIKH